MKYFGLILFISIFTISCAKQLEDLVRGNPKSPTTPQNPTARSFEVRVTPGANKASGSAVTSRFAMATEQKPVQGTQLKGKISFHQNHSR